MARLFQSFMGGFRSGLTTVRQFQS